MAAAKVALINICRKAVGELRPRWEPKTQSKAIIDFHPYRTFYTDARRDRWFFVTLFIEKELKQGMTSKQARHIGRRCRLRLIDEIRRATRHNPRRKSNKPFLAALSKVKHLRGGGKLWDHIRGCESWRHATNSAIATEWCRSESWIRKLRDRLAIHLWSVAENEEQREALKFLRLLPKKHGRALGAL
ncbi:MAG TPA: hypothetical protein VF753_16855 [Terriglobales bacterium]